MTWLRNSYLTCTVTVTIFFLSIYIYGLMEGSHWWYCLIPVWLAWFDFFRTLRNRRRFAVPPGWEGWEEEYVRDMRQRRGIPRVSPAYDWIADSIKKDKITLFTDFIKEEEFKV